MGLSLSEDHGLSAHEVRIRCLSYDGGDREDKTLAFLEKLITKTLELNRSEKNQQDKYRYLSGIADRGRPSAPAKPDDPKRMIRGIKGSTVTRQVRKETRKARELTECCSYHPRRNT